MDFLVGIDPRHNPLRGCFFVTRCPVHLTGQEKPGHLPDLQACAKLRRIKIVIFHRISRFENLHVFQPFNRV